MHIVICNKFHVHYVIEPEYVLLSYGKPGLWTNK